MSDYKYTLKGCRYPPSHRDTFGEPIIGLSFHIQKHSESGRWAPVVNLGLLGFWFVAGPNRFSTQQKYGLGFAIHTKQVSWMLPWENSVTSGRVLRWSWAA